MRPATEPPPAEAGAGMPAAAGRTLSELRAGCALPAERLQQIAADLQDEMRKGLAADGGQLAMLPSHVTRLASGAESGTWYALDLGGTNFRVLRVTLSDARGGIEGVASEEVAIPGELLRGTCQQLFAFIAARLVAFTGAAAEGALGFTFSFACKQTALDAGTLLGWTKGFALVDGPGLDVVALLRAALADAGSRLRVAALVNDTVGTLAAARYADPSACVAVILGTGTNAAYLEQLSQLRKWDGPEAVGSYMIINSEWGGFAAPSLPRLAADAAVDAASVNPGQQTFEKMISGLYLGRVAMHTLLHADAEAAQPALDAAARAALSKPDAFTAPLVSAVDSDSSPELSEASTALTKALGVQLSREALALTKEVCHLVTRRAARLSAAGVVAVLAHIGAAHPPAATAAPPTVAVDGGLFEHHQVFAATLRATIAELGVAATLRLTPDGSGVGAALLAAAAAQP